MITYTIVQTYYTVVSSISLVTVHMSHFLMRPAHTYQSAKLECCKSIGLAIFGHLPLIVWLLRAIYPCAQIQMTLRSEGSESSKVKPEDAIENTAYGFLSLLGLHPLVSNVRLMINLHCARSRVFLLRRWMSI